jgi:hypothetical protein
MALTTGTPSTIRNAFGTQTTIAVGAAGALNTFLITFPGVPTSACVQLGQLFTPANSSDFVSLTVNGTAVTAANFTTAALSGATLCAAGATVPMVWTFR